jgi:hypothetical protein
MGHLAPFRSDYSTHERPALEKTSGRLDYNTLAF